MMYRILRFTPEAVSGTFDASADKYYERCDVPNIFAPMMQPKFWVINDGKLNEPGLRGVASVAVGAQIRVRLTTENAKFYLQLCGQKVTSAPLPWATDQRIGDLASCSIDYGWTLDNLTLKRQRALGCKVQRWTLETSANETDPHIYLTMTLVGMVVQGNSIDSSVDPDATAFPEPDCSDLPVDYYQIQHAGTITINGSTRNRYRRLGVTGENMIKGYWDGGFFANRVRMNGRKITFSASQLLTSNADRALYEAGTNGGASSLVFTKGDYGFTLNFNDFNYVDEVKEDLVLDEDNYYDMTLTNFTDSCASGFTMSFTEPAP